jgi:hypothetical protein
MDRPRFTTDASFDSVSHFLKDIDARVSENFVLHVSDGVAHGLDRLAAHAFIFDLAVPDLR